MEEKKSTSGGVKEPKGLVTYDPDNLPYQQQRLCIYLAELEGWKPGQIGDGLAKEEPGEVE